MIKVLIVDDSPLESLLLQRILEKDEELKVIDFARNGREAIQKVEKYKPDVVTMDINMPLMNGIDAIKHIMSHTPLPIVVISSKLNDESLNASFHALEAGALSVLSKPDNILSADASVQFNQIIDTVKAMSSIQVVKRRFSKPMINSSNKALDEIRELTKHREIEILAIGASVGGPLALKTILAALPADFPIPIVVVQHMTKGFINGLVEWLGTATKLTVKLVADGEQLRSGVVYFAVDDFHLHIEREANQLRAKLRGTEPVNGFCPSVSVLFESVAQTAGSKSMAILLTGMGRDGADGMLSVKKVQGHTVIQDEESAVVFGMPAVAKAKGAVDKVVSLDKMAGYILQIIKSEKNG